MLASLAHIDATKRFEKKSYDQFVLKIRKDSDINRDFIKKYVESTGESMNAFITRAITETVQHDKKD